MQETFSPRDLKQSQINAVKQLDQAASKHGMNNLNTQENELSANQNLDNSKDNNKKDDKQPQTSEINNHKQDIGNNDPFVQKFTQLQSKEQQVIQEPTPQRQEQENVGLAIYTLVMKQTGKTVKQICILIAGTGEG